MFTLNTAIRLPIYEQIEQQVLAYIACGLYLPHQQLPGVRQLAKDLGINPNTVMKAYTELERNGYIYSVQGKGSFISERNPAQPGLKQEKLKDLGKLLRSAKDFGVSKTEILHVVNEVFPGEEK